MSSRLTRLSAQFKEGKLNKDAYIRKMHDVHRVLWEYHDFIRDKNVRSIEISRDSVSLITQDGVAMICNPDDKRDIPMEILNFNDYETAELRMMKKFLNPRSVVLDIGANIGWYCLNISRYVPRGKIIAFEPVARTFKLLKKNIELNRIKNVKLRNIGLSEKKGVFEFYYNPELTGATSLRNLVVSGQKEKIKCNVESLDNIAESLPQQIDFIKCDVEGAELFVIKGALNILRSAKPVLFLEMLRKWSAKFDYHPNDIIKLLSTVGYDCYCVRKKRLSRVKRITDNTQETNFYFLNNKKHNRFLKELT